MSVHFYHDDCGYVGESRAPTLRDRTDAADAERAVAFAAIERLHELFDRYDGDAGDNAEAIAGITERLLAIHEEALALLGRPARAIWQGGRIVALVTEARS